MELHYILSCFLLTGICDVIAISIPTLKDENNILDFTESNTLESRDQPYHTTCSFFHWKLCRKPTAKRVVSFILIFWLGFVQ